jgi:hypothetical protein
MMKHLLGFLTIALGTNAFAWESCSSFTSGRLAAMEIKAKKYPQEKLYLNLPVNSKCEFAVLSESSLKSFWIHDQTKLCNKPMFMLANMLVPSSLRNLSPKKAEMNLDFLSESTRDLNYRLDSYVTFELTNSKGKCEIITHININNSDKLMLSLFMKDSGMSLFGGTYIKEAELTILENGAPKVLYLK